MAAYGLKRCWPDELLPGILRAVRMNYVQNATENCPERKISRKDDLLQARISLCAWGRDYHRVIRARLDKFAGKMQEVFGPFRYREFSDSALVMEMAFTRKAEMGWKGKKFVAGQTGRFVFSGRNAARFPIVGRFREKQHCGSRMRCLPHCPTGAIVVLNMIDGHRCISYLMIELKDSIPVELRSLIGNRIYGCDDCRLVCLRPVCRKCNGIRYGGRIYCLGVESR